MSFEGFYSFRVAGLVGFVFEVVCPCGDVEGHRFSEVGGDQVFCARVMPVGALCGAGGMQSRGFRWFSRWVMGCWSAAYRFRLGGFS